MVRYWIQYFWISAYNISGCQSFLSSLLETRFSQLFCSTNKIVVVQKDARSDASCNSPQKKRRVPITIKIFDPTPKSEARKKTLLFSLLLTRFSHLFGPLRLWPFIFTSRCTCIVRISYVHIVLSKNPILDRYGIYVLFKLLLGWCSAFRGEPASAIIQQGPRAIWLADKWGGIRSREATLQKRLQFGSVKVTSLLKFFVRFSDF